MLASGRSVVARGWTVFTGSWSEIEITVIRASDVPVEKLKPQYVRVFEGSLAPKS